MASIKQAFSSETTLTVTNLHSLASSATAGWQSAVQDNTSDLYEAAFVTFILDFANTAPGNSKGVYVYMYRGVATTYDNPTSGSEGTITLVDVTSNALAVVQVGFIPYTTQDEIVEKTIRIDNLPPKWGLVLMNHSGAALHSSGNSIKWTGVYRTVS